MKRVFTFLVTVCMFFSVVKIGMMEEATTRPMPKPRLNDTDNIATTQPTNITTVKPTPNAQLNETNNTVTTGPTAKPENTEVEKLTEAPTLSTSDLALLDFVDITPAPTKKATAKPTKKPSKTQRPEETSEYYNNNCEHKHLKDRYNMEYEYTYVNEYYHSVIAKLYYRCVDCGKEIDKIQNLGLQLHFQSGRQCRCGYDFSGKIPTTNPISQATPIPYYQNEEDLITGELYSNYEQSEKHEHVLGEKLYHWYGSYAYFNEMQHSRHDVTFKYCIICGEIVRLSNTLEYVNHEFEDGTCKWCNYQCNHYNQDINAERNLYESISIGQKEHINRYNEKFKCTLCGEMVNRVETETASHSFVNGYCIVCNEKEPLFFTEELPTGNVYNWNLDSRFDYFEENVQGKGAQAILEKLSKELEKMERLNHDSKEYAITKENTLNLMTQLKMSYEYQCNVKISDAYKPYHDFMKFVDTFGLLEYIGIYKDIAEDPGFRTMVDRAIWSYDIDSDTFESALQYVKVFNKQVTYDLLGVVDVGLMAGTATEVVINGVTTSSSAKSVEELERIAAKNGHFSDDAIEHIFSGNKSGGYHYEGLNNTAGRVTNITKVPNSYGVYQAKVSINGVVKNSVSTFFPRNWTPEQVLKSIEEAYCNMSYTGMRNIYKGLSSGGMEILLYIDEATKKIISAFPSI